VTNEGPYFRRSERALNADLGHTGSREREYPALAAAVTLRPHALGCDLLALALLTFAHLALAALMAISLRRLALSRSARALPPALVAVARVHSLTVFFILGMGTAYTSAC
jgi:hypothetical protein